MRILGVTTKWPKLKRPFWTTFRLPRRDKDWQVGEEVQVVYKPRSKQREVLGAARIIEKIAKRFWSPSTRGNIITKAEVIEDGFESVQEMWRWMLKAHGARVRQEPLNKLTVEWIR
ncbi:unnamed protein product, partial [marine sediment metagenome]